MKVVSSSSSLVLDFFVYVGLLVITILPLYFLDILWLKPERLRKKLERQGIRGPKPSFPYGNVGEMQKIHVAAITMRGSRSKNGDFVGDDYTCLLFPYFEQWRKKYGVRPHVDFAGEPIDRQVNNFQAAESGEIEVTADYIMGQVTRSSGG
ncbi:hypothetical protein L1987_15609 [Smallanthus sonchifolius]|uniref:Uncharacterized protein n=1 Tax=Smallanthus sonchifolius TaxID=185202 RepID=A0ACB9J6J9_9ASTR|nr:hypothetical protein L1987_15609 [Smallanthus sonchifolius]